MDQGSQRSPAQQIGSTFWLILMTLLFTQSVTVNNLKLEDYRHKPYYSYDDYANALSGGVAGAIIDEVPYIKMFLGKYSDDYAMISSEPKTSGFAFVFQKGSPLATDMSRQIAKIRENGILGDLEKKWFQKRSSSSQSKPKTLNFGTFRGLFLISGISSAIALMISMICLLRANLEHYFLPLSEKFVSYFEASLT